ncbi:TPA: hypothetical protein ACHUT1_004364, partial [Shigella boydii]
FMPLPVLTNRIIGGHERKPRYLLIPGFSLAWQKCVSCFSGEGYPTSVRNGKWRLIYSGEGCMGKGGGKAHTPREAKDNLKSTQMM